MEDQIKLELEKLIEQDRITKTIIRWLVIGGMNVGEAVKFTVGYTNENNRI